MIGLILEVSFYVISCAMAMISELDLDFILHISSCVIFTEITKHCFTMILDDINVETETLILDQEMEVVEKKEKIPIVNSMMVYKMCEGLGINVQIAPIENRKTRMCKFNDHPKCVNPMAASEIKGQMSKLKSQKVISVVKSASVFMFCTALGIEAILDPLQD
ncbi:hypothetical protein NPIL_40631 [Nephila pilipes]|uniref:Uncharacterized protein n=1 Tax=Nephila pilipes TaxID=299642 RepID=A0A8X6UA66_NEPPI|nr:hypothetical protein NPIL_40631 [Nephila pilipes]